MKHSVKKLFALLLTVALLLAAVPTASASGSFWDVPGGTWYETYLDKIIWAQQQMNTNKIITGYEDGSFKPDKAVTRGEWLKMLIEAETLTGSTAPASDDGGYWHWAAKYYIFAKNQNILVADVYSSTRDMFGNLEDYGSWETKNSALTAALNQPITRYEMAVILNNLCTNIAMQKVVSTTDASKHITDYSLIPDQYTNAVEQMYGKGLLVGDENGRFNGSNTLTRAQAVTVLYKYLFVDTINGEGLQDWAEYPKTNSTQNALSICAPEDSFANRLKNHYHYENGKLVIDDEFKMELFGTTDRSHFRSAAEAAPYMMTVSVPIWTVDKSGNKVSSFASITVNRAVQKEVRAIFQMIYDDPEQFPIYGGWSAGGARYTDDKRHSWGCAIDINAYYNCECNFRSGPLKVTCGYGWWPIGHNDSTFAGSMSGPSIYSIGATEGEYGYSVVKAFATYGWGWGGNGWSGGTSYDYMHFSVLQNGG